MFTQKNPKLEIRDTILSDNVSSKSNPYTNSIILGFHFGGEAKNTPSGIYKYILDYLKNQNKYTNFKFYSLPINIPDNKHYEYLVDLSSLNLDSYSKDESIIIGFSDINITQTFNLAFNTKNSFQNDLVELLKTSFVSQFTEITSQANNQFILKSNSEYSSLTLKIGTNEVLTTKKAKSIPGKPTYPSFRISLETSLLHKDDELRFEFLGKSFTFMVRDVDSVLPDFLAFLNSLDFLSECFAFSLSNSTIIAKSKDIFPSEELPFNTTHSGFSIQQVDKCSALNFKDEVLSKTIEYLTEFNDFSFVLSFDFSFSKTIYELIDFTKYYLFLVTYETLDSCTTQALTKYKQMDMQYLLSFARLTYLLKNINYDILLLKVFAYLSLRLEKDSSLNPKYYYNELHRDELLGGFHKCTAPMTNVRMSVYNNSDSKLLTQKEVDNLNRVGFNVFGLRDSEVVLDKMITFTKINPLASYFVSLNAVKIIKTYFNLQYKKLFSNSRVLKGGTHTNSTLSLNSVHEENLKNMIIEGIDFFHKNYLIDMTYKEVLELKKSISVNVLKIPEGIEFKVAVENMFKLVRSNEGAKIILIGG